MSTPKEFFELPKGWEWEGQWEVEPQQGSLVSEDFMVTNWADKRYETVDYSDDEDIIVSWKSKVPILPNQLSKTKPHYYDELQES